MIEGEGMKKFYLLRHCQTLFNRHGRIQGWSDSPLTDLGIAQAKQVRTYFDKPGLSFDSLYSSPAEWACDTVELATGRKDYQRLKGLKELNFGEFEAQPEYLHPDKRFFLTVPDHYKRFGGKGRDELKDRIYQTIKRIAETDPGQRILIGTHGAVSSTFAAAVMQSLVAYRLSMPNCSVYEYNYTDGQFQLVRIHDPQNGNIIDIEGEPDA